MDNFEKKFAAAGADLKTQCVSLEILVAVDLLEPAECWAAVAATMEAFNAYFSEEQRPAGIIYPVSRIPNLDVSWRFSVLFFPCKIYTVC
jgi:enamine deaminase RidA (YjgF/YER057c/UK114 family)